MEEAIRSTGESVSQDATSVNSQFSQCVYVANDDEILSDLDTAKLTTQAERGGIFPMGTPRTSCSGHIQSYYHKIATLCLIPDNVGIKQSVFVAIYW